MHQDGRPLREVGGGLASWNHRECLYTLVVRRCEVDSLVFPVVTGCVLACAVPLWHPLSPCFQPVWLRENKTMLTYKV